MHAQLPVKLVACLHASQRKKFGSTGSISQAATECMLSNGLDPRSRHHGPGAAKFPDPHKSHTENLHTGELCGKQTSALGTGRGCSTSPCHAGTGAGCRLCSPGPHHLLGHNPALLQVGSTQRKLVLYILKVCIMHTLRISLGFWWAAE